MSTVNGSGRRAPNIRKVNPSRCRMWRLHDRLGERIDEESCSSLIESIEKHGQRHPVLGRGIRDADGYEIELIYGARRLFAAQQLGIDIVVDVQEIDDQSAIVEMFVENRARVDISPYERGISYARWLRSGIFTNQTEIAKALGVSEAQISRLLRYAQLPAVVVAAFNSGCDIREEWATVLAKSCEDSDSRSIVLRRAREYAASERRSSPQAVYDSLVNGVARKLVKAKARDEVVRDSKGLPIARLQFRVKTVHVILPRRDLEVPTLQAAVAAMVKVLEAAAVSSPAVPMRKRAATASMGESR